MVSVTAGRGRSVRASSVPVISILYLYYDFMLYIRKVRELTLDVLAFVSVLLPLILRHPQDYI